MRDKNLVNNLSEVDIGSDYRRILDHEKRVEQVVLQRMKETGGFCLPDFVKKGKNIWFAIENIDLLADWTEVAPSFGLIKHPWLSSLSQDGATERC